MRKSIDHGLYAISPTIDYKDFYLSYHRRKNPIFIPKDNELPKIKNISLRTEISVQDSKNENFLNNIITTNSKFNSIYNKMDNNKTNSLNFSTYSPFIKTEQICYPKINPIIAQIKNFISPYKTKIKKKVGKLTITNLDIINMDLKNSLLIYQINEKEKLLENEITKNFYDSPTKKKIINEIKTIDKNTNKEIDNIMKNSTREEKAYCLKNFEIQPKIINLCAEEIFEEFNNKRNIGVNTDLEDPFIIKKNKIKNKEQKEKKLNDIFLDFAKNNIRRKIELRNQYNQELSIEYIEQLILNEIEKIKFILALYYYNSSTHVRNSSFNSEVANSSILLKDINHKNLLDRSFDKFYRLNNYYNYLSIKDNKDRNSHLYKKNKNFFNTIEKSKLSNRYNPDTDYINALKNQLPNNNDEEDNKDNKDNNENNDNKYKKDNNLSLEQSIKDKTLFLLYHNKRMIPSSKLTKHNSKDLNNYISINQENFKEKNSTLEENQFQFDKNKLNKEKNKIFLNKIEDEDNKKNPIKNNGYKSENDKSESQINNGKFSVIKQNNNLNKKNKNKDIDSDLKEKYNSQINKKIKEKNEYKEKEEKKENKRDDDDDEEENKGEEDKENEKKKEGKKDKKDKEENKEKENVYRDNKILNKENNEIINEDDNEYEENEKYNINNDNNDITNNDSEKINDSEIYEKEIKNEVKESNKSLDIINEKIKSNDIFKEGKEKSITIQQMQEKNPKKKSNKRTKSSDNQTKKINEQKDQEQKMGTKTNNQNNNQRPELIESLFYKRNNYLKKKERRNFKRLKTLNIKNIGKKKKINSSKKRRNSFSSRVKSPRSLIKNFEPIRTIRKRRLSEGNINIDQNNSNEVNIIKLQDADIEKILNYINEEEKKKLTRIEKEKIEKEEEDIHSLFKEKKQENINDDNLTKDDFVQKLKKDDLKMREYIEGIIRSGLTAGNKKLYRQMKNNSILVYKNYNLGQFKFNKNFGIIEDFRFEILRPLSGKENINEEEDTKDDQDSPKNRKNKKEKKIKEIKNDNEKEEPKKELIYDNKYLFTKKKKKTVKFMLRKEVEDILNGGILSHQQIQEKPEEKKVEIKKSRFESPKKVFIKKKTDRRKLIKKSKYLQELFDAESLNKVTEEDLLAKELKMKELIREKNIDNRLNEFIDRIKTLKNNEINGSDSLDNIDIYINQRLKIDDNEKDKKEKENRINEFLDSLNDYRKMKKQQRRLNNTILYKEPIMVENLMVENYEESINNKNMKNKNIKRKLSLKDIDNIQNVDKIFSTKKNKNNCIENKSYLTEINYYH